MGKRLNKFLYTEVNHGLYKDHDRSLYEIKNRFDETNLCDSHILCGHTSLSYNDMIKKLKNKNNISSYKNINDCLKAVSHGLVQEWTKIINWLEYNTTDTLTIETNMPEGIFGVGIKKNDEQKILRIFARQSIILKRQNTSLYGFKILTAYPIE